MLTEQTTNGARALAISSTVLAAGTGAHVMGGGALPSLLALAALASLTLAVASALARLRPRLAVLGPVMVASQYALHHAFMYLGTGSTSSATGADHAHHGATVDLGTMTATAAGHDHSTSALMTVTHAVAALVAALLITSSDRAGRAAARWWSALVPAVPAVSPLPTRLRAVLPRGPQVPALTPAFRRCVQRRGPPELHAA
ncbi:hypothetical protein [Paraoerskovia marina]|uniref:hypothetical protein n=1 Tax=Paraoerskovia marina TaxID=545619 RepID=UPI000492A4E1|nr:hypothetical protein [Paraoerskovia marina]